jgi:uncharacterized membrane protein YdbT with pleckstrin-like domain
MATYVEESLVTHEHVLYQGRLSKWPYFLRILLGIILAPILIGLIILIDLAIKLKSTELAVTNRRVIAKFGTFRRRTFELNVDRVEAIQVDQGIWGRMLGYGTLRIAGAGNFDPIPAVAHPIAFKKAVLESQEAFHESFVR